MARMIRPRPISSPTSTIQFQGPSAVGLVLSVAEGVVRVAGSVGEGIGVTDGIEVGEGRDEASP